MKGQDISHEMKNTKEHPRQSYFNIMVYDANI